MKKMLLTVSDGEGAMVWRWDSGGFGKKPYKQAQKEAGCDGDDCD